MSTRKSTSARAGQPSRATFNDRACLTCQRRKTRCVPEANTRSCTYCVKVGKNCVFGAPPARTALTRKNLDAIESRCRRLEARLRRLRPNLDVEDLTSENHDLEELDSLGSFAAHAAAPALLSGAQNQLPTAATRSAIVDLTRNSIQGSPRDFEWQETFDTGSGDGDLHEGRDGMASLTAASHDSGYLGKTSGSSLLKSIKPLLRSKKQPSAADARTDRVIQEPPLDTISSLFYGPSTSAVEEQLIGIYFTCYNASYPIVHERTFRDQCKRRSQIAAHSHWHIVYYMVLAIGEWIIGFSSDATSIYYEAARSRLRIEVLESGSVSIVQAFLLMGNYLQKKDRPNTGYNFIGIAYRVALGLGLHREVSPDITVEGFAPQQRRLLFWTLYCFESGFSITTGRPILVSDSFIDIRKPQNVDDSISMASHSRPVEVDYPTTCSAIIAQARLAVIANKVHNDFLSARACTDVNHQVAIVEQRINNWRSSLPTFFFASDVPKWFLGPRQVVIWKESNIRILLLLAGERHHIEEQDKAAIGAKCQFVAIETIFDIANFCQKHIDVVHMGLSWYAVYFLLQAILALGIHEKKKSDRLASRSASLELRDASDQCQSAVSRAWKCLESLSPKNKAATRTMHILERLFDGAKVPDSELDHGTGTFSSAPENGRDSTPQVIEDGQPHSRLNFSGPINEQVTENNFDEFPVPAEIDLLSGPSPNDIIGTDFVENDWVGTMDPSLHMFFDNSQNINEIFHGVQGFPNTIEHENFEYMTSSMQTVRSAFSKGHPSSSENASGEQLSWPGGTYM